MSSSFYSEPNIKNKTFNTIPNNNFNNSNQEETKTNTTNTEKRKKEIEAILSKIDKKLSSLSNKDKIIFLKSKINEFKYKYGNKSKLLFQTISKYLRVQLTIGDIFYNDGNYTKSLETYKDCLQISEPLPESDWLKYNEWVYLRITIYNSIATNYERINKREQAIEYMKLSSNLEETFNIKGEHKNKYNNICYITGKQLILSEKYSEALKYLLKVEKNMNDEYSIDKIFKREKIDIKMDKKFLQHSPDEYVNILNLISKCYVKLNDYNNGDKFYDKYEEMYEILSKVKKMKYPFAGEHKDFNMSEINNINNNSINTDYEESILGNNLMVDKAEENNKLNNIKNNFPIINKKNKPESAKKFKNDDSFKENINIIETENINIKPTKKISPPNISNNSLNANKKRASFVSKKNPDSKNNNSMSNVFSNNNKDFNKKLSKTKSQIFFRDTQNNLKNAVKQGNVYPPYDFVFKKPENIIKNEKLPKLAINNSKNSNDINKLQERKTIFEETKKRSSSNQLKNISRFVRIEEKLNVIEKSIIDTKDTILNEFNEKKSKNISYEKYNHKKISENPINTVNNVYSYKENNENKKNDDNKRSTSFQRKRKFLLPKITKKNVKINVEIKKDVKKDIKKDVKKGKNLKMKNIPISANISKIKEVQKFKFPSQEKKDYLDSSERMNDELNKLNKFKEKEKQVKVIIKKKSGKNIHSVLSFGKKSSGSIDGSRSESDSSDDEKIIVNKVKDKLEIKKINEFNPKKIDINKDKNKKLNDETKLKFISFVDLLYKYYSNMNLIDKKALNKNETYFQKFQSNNIVFNKIINNKLYTVTVLLPIYNINDSDKKNSDNLPFLMTEIIFQRKESVFYTKYKIELPINKNIQSSNEELKQQIIELLLKKKKNYNFSWIIFLYYFENFFSSFKDDFEKKARDLIHGNKDNKSSTENNKAEEKDKMTKIKNEFIIYFIGVINNNLYNITQWRNKRILTGIEKNPKDQKNPDENENNEKKTENSEKNTDKNTDKNTEKSTEKNTEKNTENLEKSNISEKSDNNKSENGENSESAFTSLMYYNLLYKYLNIFINFLSVHQNIITDKINMQNLDIESIKNKSILYINSINGIIKYKHEFRELEHRCLLKKVIYDSFIDTTNILSKIENVDETIKNAKSKPDTLTKEDIIRNIHSNQSEHMEQFFFDNEIIYKGIIKMPNHDYMYMIITIRVFEEVLKNEYNLTIFGNNPNNILEKSKSINFENLTFLSNDPEISKKLAVINNIDLTKKAYDKTKYNTFLQIILLDLNLSSNNWSDITYMSWEMYYYFIGLFQEPINKFFFMLNSPTITEIGYNRRLNSFVGLMLQYFISDFCSVEHNTLAIIKNLYEDKLYPKMFMKLYDLYDHYIYNIIDREKKVKHDYILLSMYIRNFYIFFLTKIHRYYYKYFFKELKQRTKNNLLNEKIDFNDSGFEEELSKYIKGNKPQTQNKTEEIVNYKLNYKSIFEAEMEPCKVDNKMTFNIFLTLENKRYNAIFKISYEKLQITADPEDIKNFLVDPYSFPKIFIQLRSIFSNDLIQTNIYNLNLINNIKYMIDNNNEKLLKCYFENLIHIIPIINGKRIILDFNYKKDFLSSAIHAHDYTNEHLNILNKISLTLLHESDYLFAHLPEGIKLIKSYKECFINKNMQKIFLIFKIFRDIKTKKPTNTQTNTIKDDNSSIKKEISESIYSKMFSRKMTKTLSNMGKKEENSEEKNKKDIYQKILNFFILIDIYFPKTGLRSAFILSIYDLNAILKKIKNKNIRTKYLIAPENFITLLPKKISLVNTEVGKKVYINFTKYKNLRMDWKEQLLVQNNKNKELLREKLSAGIEKKFELKIYLKPNFVNFESRDSIYEIDTNEMELTIKLVKRYKINGKILNCIISIYYHKILEYWTLIFFFPFSARRFTTVLEPKHMEYIVTNNLKDISPENGNDIQDKDIWKFIINSSNISFNKECNAYFGIIDVKLLLRELLYYGYELINDGFQTELNKVIYIEITMKSLNLFTLGQIDQIIEKVEIDECNFIFQSFSFHELSWHKENLKLEYLEPLFKKYIISEESVVKLKEVPNNEEATDGFKNTRLGNQSEFVANTKVEIRRFLPFCQLRKLITSFIQPYVNSQQHVFEKKKKLFDIGKTDGNLQTLINSVIYDKKQRKAISRFYQMKLDNKIIFNNIYTENISYNPPITATVGINLVKEKIFITLYYPYKSKKYDIEIDFETVKKLFFPYFNDILIVDKIALGRRILRRYQNFIKQTPHFLKLFQSDN